MRDPRHPNWPGRGDKTDDAETAQRWAWAYLDLVRDESKRRHLGLRGPGKPLAAEVSRFLEHQERSRRTRTHLAARAALETQIIPALGAETIIDTVEPAQIQMWVNAMLDRTPPYAIGTVTRYLATARAFFRWATDKKHDPTQGVEIPKQKESDTAAWSDDELAKLRAAADKLDQAPRPNGRQSRVTSLRVALELALATGARVGELAALEWASFDRHARTVRVKHQVRPDGYGMELDPVKGGKPRFALVLPSWWAFHGENARGYVLSRTGEPVPHRVMQRVFDRILKAAGLKTPWKNAHSCRHTYALHCLDAGVRMEELQKFLGHGSIRITEQYYDHFDSAHAAGTARARVYGLTLEVSPRQGRKGAVAS